jgi:hypothetical protein
MLGHHLSAEQWLKQKNWWSENSTDPSTYITLAMVRQGQRDELHRLWASLSHISREHPLRIAACLYLFSKRLQAFAKVVCLMN